MIQKKRKTVEFEISGGFPIPQDNRNMFGKNDFKVFWQGDAGDHASFVGCYIFYRQAGPGATPIYVGSATKSFKQEVFHAQKIADHYSPSLWDKKHHRINGSYHLLFFELVKKQKKDGQPRKLSKSDLLAISALEQHLIQEALKKNRNLSNIHYTGGPPFQIQNLKRKNDRGRAAYTHVMTRPRTKRMT